MRRIIMCAWQETLVNYERVVVTVECARTSLTFSSGCNSRSGKG